MGSDKQIETAQPHSVGLASLPLEALSRIMSFVLLDLEPVEFQSATHRLSLIFCIFNDLFSKFPSPWLRTSTAPSHFARR